MGIFYLLRGSSWISEEKILQNLPKLDAVADSPSPPKDQSPKMLTCSWGGDRGRLTDSESLSILPPTPPIPFLFINIHIQECAHFSAAEHDKGKRFQWWILVCVCKFHACGVGLIARETEVLLFLPKQLQSRERQCERPSPARPAGMTGGTL